MNDMLFILDFVARAVWHVLPAFIFSVLLGVLVRALKLDGAIRRAFSARIGLAILLATAVGAFSPFCSCTVVPVISGLLLAGVPLAPVMAFWIASPTMDPEIFALSVATLGWPLALMRLGSTLALSLGAGYMTLAFTRAGWFARPLKASNETAANPAQSPPPVVVPAIAFLVPAMETAGVPHYARARVNAAPGLFSTAAISAAPATASATAAGGCDAGCSIPRPVALACDCAAPACGGNAAPGAASRGRRALAERTRLLAADVFRDVAVQTLNLGRWLLLAFVMEALILRYVPQEAIAGILGQQNPLAVPLAALIGVPLYLNNLGALPIVSGLLAQGMQPGAAIAFLVAGPVTTIPAMTAVWGIARREVFILYLTVALAGSVLAGFVTNLILG